LIFFLGLNQCQTNIDKREDAKPKKADSCTCEGVDAGCSVIKPRPRRKIRYVCFKGYEEMTGKKKINTRMCDQHQVRGILKAGGRDNDNYKQL
jgi:hypothetical protein